MMIRPLVMAMAFFSIGGMWGCAAQRPKDSAQGARVNTASHPPSGSIAYFSLPAKDRALYSLSAWISTAASEDEYFERAMRSFQDLRQDYDHRIQAGFERSVARTEVMLAVRARIRDYVSFPAEKMHFAINPIRVALTNKDYSKAKGAFSIELQIVAESPWISASTAIPASAVRFKDPGYSKNTTAVLAVLAYGNSKPNISDISTVMPPNISLVMPYSQDQLTALTYQTMKDGRGRIELRGDGGYVTFSGIKCSPRQYSNSSSDEPHLYCILQRNKTVLSEFAVVTSR